MQKSPKEILKHAADISSGKESSSRIIYDTLSRTSVNTILPRGETTNLDGYPETNDHPAISEEDMDGNLKS